MTIEEAFNLARQRHEAGDVMGAASHYLFAGLRLADDRRLSEAVAALERSLALDPLCHEACYHLGNALRDSGKTSQAVAAYQRGLSLRPDQHIALNALGASLVYMGKFEEAIAVFGRATAVRPDCADSHNNLGSALRESGRLDESIRIFERLLARWPEYAQGHWNLALALLEKGEFARGWKEYEWRWRVPELRLRLKLHSPRWDGGDLTGKTIVLHGEQGLGDNIQFVRYVQQVVAGAGKVILVCQRELHGLFSGIAGVERIASDEQPAPDHDVHCPLMSLPGILGTTLATIPAAAPYLAADMSRVEQWRRRVPADKRLKVGLAWAGLGIHPNDRNRSIALELLLPLAEAPNVWLCSLQKGDASGQVRSARFEINDWSNELLDFADTAALIENLDLVIAVDTAVAHLAGALGKPVWLLVPFSPDWRWGLQRTDSPWYPTMRLFRQPHWGDWTTPIEQMVRELGVMGP